MFGQIVGMNDLRAERGDLIGVAGGSRDMGAPGEESFGHALPGETAAEDQDFQVGPPVWISEAELKF